MSRYKRFRVDKVRDYSLESRPSKVQVDQFAKPFKGDSFSDFASTLPRILAVSELFELVDRIRRARDRAKPMILGFGGHVVKVGLSPILIDLMREGWVTSLATNGSGIIHDFEIAACGGTSEEVEVQIKDGAFGMARETGEGLNCAVRKGVSQGKGIGESVGEFLAAHRELRYPQLSVAREAYELSIPLTVHVAIGTDIVHNHPEASGQAWGEGSLIDFQILTQQVSELGGGGVYLNFGSAVLLPEVFLKAVSMVRNAGIPLEDFTTANFDFIQHYRPTQNVVRRPVAGSGKGFALTGHHEIMMPLVAALLKSGRPSPK